MNPAPGRFNALRGEFLLSQAAPTSRVFLAAQCGKGRSVEDAQILVKLANDGGSPHDLS